MFARPILRLMLCATAALSLSSCQVLGSILKIPFSFLGGLTGSSGSLLGEANPSGDEATHRAAEIEPQGTYLGKPQPSILEADRVAVYRGLEER